MPKRSRLHSQSPGPSEKRQATADTTLISTDEEDEEHYEVVLIRDSITITVERSCKMYGLLLGDNHFHQWDEEDAVVHVIFHMHLCKFI